MGENFVKFKKKAFKIRLFKSISSALGAGALVAGALTLLWKLELIGLGPLYATLIGACAALLTGLLVFLLLRISDKGLARLLDSELGLSERVQTMLEYSSESSAIHKLQREDANERLSEASPKFLKIKRLWFYILFLALGVGALVTSLVYSKQTEPPPPVILEKFEITEMQIKAMDELIQSVKASQMASPYRENTAEILSELLETLKTTDTVVDKNAAVDLAMKAILLETDNSSSAVELMVALWSLEGEQTKQLAKAINYYEWPKLDEWDKFYSGFTDFRATFLHSDVATDEPDEEKINNETALFLLKASTNIAQALVTSGISEEDPLYKQLSRLAVAEEENDDGTRVWGLAKLSALIPTSGYESVQRELDSTVIALSAELFSALSAHRINTDTGEGAIKRVGEIFDCPLVRFERPAFIESSEGGASSEDEGSGGGSIGSGMDFGSDDLVLDPYTNTYVPYGVIVERYYELMFGGLISGDYTDEQEEAMKKYFAILYGDKHKGEENDQ